MKCRKDFNDCFDVMTRPEVCQHSDWNSFLFKESPCFPVL